MKSNHFAFKLGVAFALGWCAALLVLIKFGFIQ